MLHHDSWLAFRTRTIDHQRYRQSPGVVRATLRGIDLNHFDYSCLQRNPINRQSSTYKAQDTHQSRDARPVVTGWQLSLPVPYLRNSLDHKAINKNFEGRKHEKRGRRHQTHHFLPFLHNFVETSR